jgi:hypothetical protein
VDWGASVAANNYHSCADPTQSGNRDVVESLGRLRRLARSALAFLRGFATTCHRRTSRTFSDIIKQDGCAP